MAMSPRLLRPVASGFDPRRITGLAVWLDPSNTASLTYNGSSISQINDGSGNGRHFVQDTAGSQPGTTTVNGRNALLFDGKWMRQNALSAYANRTTFVVARRDAGTNSNGFAAVFGYRSGASFAGISNSDTFFQLRANNSTAGTPLMFDTGNTASPTAWIDGIPSNPSSPSAASPFNPCPFATDGVLRVLSMNTTQTGSGNKMPLIAVEGNVITRTYLMTLCELLIYSVELSASERQKVERYLGKKWGVTVS